jgi:hypothetical protein
MAIEAGTKRLALEMEQLPIIPYYHQSGYLCIVKQAALISGPSLPIKNVGDMYRKIERV